jgi:hypothetical protein
VVSTSANYTFTATSNHTLVANFTQTYTISVTDSPGAGGTTSGNGTYVNGSSVTVTATANSGYVFTNWTESGSVVSMSASYTFTATANRNLVANFTQTSIQITVQTNPLGLAFSVDGTNYTTAQTFSWAPGSSHTIATTSPQSGAVGVRYVWSNWSGGGAISHTVAPTTNTTYTATFITQYY